MSLADKLANRPQGTGQAAAVAARMQSDQQDPDAAILLISQIEEDEGQARKTFEGLEELAASIGAHGQQQPIVVIELSRFRYKLKAGARRFRSMRDILKSDTIRATIDRTGSENDRVKFRLGQLHENIQRHDYKPFELAAELQLLINETGWTLERLSVEVGMSKGWISKKLSLLKAPPEIQAAIQSGELAETDYFNNKEEATAKATKRTRPEGEGGGTGSGATKMPKKLSMTWEDGAALGGLLVGFLRKEHPDGFADLTLAPSASPEEVQAFFDTIKNTFYPKK